MERKNIPAAGEFYRHFKGNLYQIIGVAKHSETLESLVVYQALYGDYGLYVRPLNEFMSPVDRAKYPEAVQKYRFEQVMSGECAIVTEKKEEKTQSEIHEIENDDTRETVREEILRFLDAEGDAEKLDVLRSLRRNMDEQLLTTIELSLDLLPDAKESLDRRFDFVERTLEQRIRFEGGRLR